MTELVASVASRALSVGRLADLAALGKPRLSALVIFTAAMGVWCAPQSLDLGATVLFLLSTAGLVAAANTLNCWLERDIDSLMARTASRPLPGGRLEPRVALVQGVVVSAASLAGLALSTNVRTVLLGAAALLLYVAVYTPLKRLSPWALFVGAVPGALPPLMGYTAAADRLDAAGWFLFGILFLWQLPHFIAISLYLEDDFRRAGIRALPIVHGRRSARVWLFACVAALLGFSLLGLPLGIAGPAYAAIAVLIGLAWLGLAASGLHPQPAGNWARRLFGFSLLYLPILITALVLDVW
jgi:protoheme IX farnesyltransferase